MGVKVKARIQWSEKARLQLVQAVIHVEADILKQDNKWTLLSSPRQRRKWDRINNLLPPELQGRTLSCNSHKYNPHKCKRVFDELLRTYRDPSRRRQAGCLFYALTKSVHELMKKREDQLNAAVSLNCTETTLSWTSSTNEVIPSTRSVKDSGQVPSTRCRGMINMAEPSVKIPEVQFQAHTSTNEREFNSATMQMPWYHPRASNSVRKSVPRKLPRRL